MDINRLVAMANRIGEFFDALPDTVQGMRGVACHIGDNWEPRMRRQLASHLDAAAQTGLTPFVERALRTNQSLWRVTHAPGTPTSSAQ